jgi:hypothetical protein
MKKLILLFAVALLPVAGFAQSGTTGNLTVFLPCKCIKK